MRAYAPTNRRRGAPGVDGEDASSAVAPQFTVVTATRDAGTAALQATTSATAASGLVSFSNLSYNKAETITIDFNSGSLTGATSGNVTVSPAAANKLTILTQPPSTAIAGVAFSPQPQVRIEDQFGNLRSADNATVVTATRLLGAGGLQGTTSLTAIGGLVTYTNLSYNVAETIALVFGSGSLTPVTSSNVVVSPGAANRLILVLRAGASGDQSGSIRPT